MFPFCNGIAEELNNAEITDAEVYEKERKIFLKVHFAGPVSFSLTGRIEDALKEAYGLSDARVDAVFAAAPPVETKKETSSATSGKEKVDEGTPIYGKRSKSKIIPMSELTLETGKCAVEGDVFAVTSRELQKRGSAILTFDMTDRTNSVRVSKFLRNDDDQTIINKISEGDHLIVCGDIVYSKYDGDMVLEPTGILKSKKVIRKDTAERKRVELHMHTRMSTQDALTDPAEIVKRAEYWGMPAVAVTDHGTVQGFPEMYSAAKKRNIKIIYGMECYFVNDTDGSSAVTGRSKLPVDTEYVAFDVETTGLNAKEDRLIEIGACIFKGSEKIDEFDTFVDPKMHIPSEITQLTGITDEMVKDAPSDAEAVQSFIEFCGGRPVIAHNAHFDMSFINYACQRNEIDFSPVVLDTLPMAKALLPELKKYKLDVVSDHLKLPKFNHHRACDDAAVVWRIMDKFIPLFEAMGARTIDEIEVKCRENNRAEAEKSYHMILLVKNKKGLKNLYEIVSQSYLKYFHRNPLVPKSVLNQYREGIIVGSACGMGELYGAILRGENDAELERIASYYDYLEIQPIANNAFLINDGRVKDETVLQDYNRQIYNLGKKLGKPVVATCDVHFMDPEDEQLRRILQSAKKFSDADRECPIFFRTTDEMLKEFEYLGPEIAEEVVIDSTNAIADMVETFELFPKGLFPPKIENSAQQLRDLVYGKMHRIYGENPPQLVKDRVDIELNTILDHNYDVIYMSAQKLVENSLEHGYLVGSRGSVGSSIVAYMSGITEVNAFPPHYVCPNCCHSEFITDGSYGCGADMPEKECPECHTLMNRDGFDIPFETFLGFPENAKTPDIDLNFSGEYQANAHKYTETLFGADHVFRAGTIGTLAEKTAYGYVKKYLEERNITVSKAEENRLAAGLVGIKRTTGQHPGGLVIIPQDMDVTDFCPVQHPADDSTKGIITTHFEYHCMEDNLLKLDELGHDDPTMIRMMEDMTGVDAKKISLSDPDTMSIFTSPAVLGIPEDDPIIGKTGSLAVPEFGTGFTRQMLVDTQPKSFDILVRLSGFSHGTDVWAGNIRDLVTGGIADVKETVGCRDDIMQTLIAKGMKPTLAFKTMEMVRKGKVKKSGVFPDDAEQQMRDMGIPDWWIESCRKIAYLFPKAHAVAYVMMAFRIAWFKVHEPLAFYSAYFYRRSQKGEFDAEMMTRGIDATRKKIKELYNKQDKTANEEDLLVTLEVVYEFYLRGFEFAPLDIYKSDATKFLITEEKKLRPPFVSVSGLGEAAALDIVAARDKGEEFISIEEFSFACPKASQTNLLTLKQLGAFGEMPDSSQITLFEF